MNFLLISTLVIASVTFLPAITYGSATTEIEEQPHALPIVAANAAQKIAGEIWQEDDHEVLIRSERGAKNNGDGGAAVTEGSASCRYEKSQWTDCNQETNVRTRVLTLKKGDEECVPTRTIQKKCKKAACRYNRGEWSECVNGTMTRKDTIRPGCEAAKSKPLREINKNCNQKKKNKNKKNAHSTIAK